jgi:hypothetical protein
MHIALRALPASAVGASTFCVFEAVTVHPLPVVVRVKIAKPEYVAGGVHLAFKFVGSGVKVPPKPPSDHIPPVADPPTEPPSGAEIPPLQITVRAGPASAVGASSTFCVFETVTGVHTPPVVVKIKLAVPE